MEKPFKFGKYKGQTPSEVAQDLNGRKYLEWYLQQPIKEEYRKTEEIVRKSIQEALQSHTDKFQTEKKTPMLDAVKIVSKDSLPSNGVQQEVFLLEKISSQLDVITTLINQKLLE